MSTQIVSNIGLNMRIDWKLHFPAQHHKLLQVQFRAPITKTETSKDKTHGHTRKHEHIIKNNTNIFNIVFED